MVRLWALAVLFHLAANPGPILTAISPRSGATPLVGFIQLGLAGSALVAVFSPSARRAGLVSGLYLLVTWLKLPTVGNHEVILGLVALAVAVAALRSGGALRSGAHGRPSVENWALPVVGAGRWILVISYSFIAFSKLNRGFFDPAVSCAAVFADELTGLVGFSSQAFDRLDPAVIGVVAAVELAIPAMLVSKRFRSPGAALGLVFHGVLALDPVGHVWDFSATLLPLFVLFLPPEFSSTVHRTAWLVVGRIRARGSNAPALVVAVVLAAQALVLVGPVPTWLVAYPLWLAVAGPITAMAVAVAGSDAYRFERLPQPVGRPGGGAMTAIVGLALLIGLGPYLGFRSAAAFNMYSNLQIFDGRSNHYLIPAVPFEAGSASRIVWADPDSPLEYYVETGLAVPNENLRRYLQASPDEDPVIAPVNPTAGISAAGSSAPAALLIRASDADAVKAREPRGLVGSALDRLRHKLGFRRAVDPDGPVSCLRAWGPAG
jgi:hypothetical protein